MSNNVCNELRERIVRLYYRPGDSLNEKKLAEEFGVSRTPIREALIRLSAENLVTIIPNSGTRVSDINLIDFQELIGLRLILERGVARLATQNTTEEEIQALERLRDRLRLLGDEDVSELMEIDREFHQIIRQASHNHLLDKYLSIIQNQFTRIQRLLSKPDRTAIDLSKVIQLLKQKDADEMERLLVEHVEGFVAKVSNYF